MNGYNFTERVRKVLARAREEATALHHEYVGSEHMLLSLLSDDGVASVVLRNLDVDPSEAEHGVRQAIQPGRTEAPLSRHDVPYTSASKRILEFAMTEARELNHSYVGTEHLLLGLMRDQKNIAAQVLSSLGPDVREGARGDAADPRYRCSGDAITAGRRETELHCRDTQVLEWRRGQPEFQGLGRSRSLPYRSVAGNLNERL